jgi:uncharacterized protein YggT (Ycf19 family)
MNFTFSIYIFLDFIKYLVIFHIILSWLANFWLNIKPSFLKSIIDPLYNGIKDLIPTTVWPLDFTGVIILLIVFFLTGLLETFFPGTLSYYNAYKSSIF